MAITINNSAIVVEVDMVRGDDFVNPFRIGGKPTASDPTEYWDLTGWDLRGQVRRKETSDVVLATMEVTPFDDQTDEENTGKFTVAIADDEGTDLGTKMFPRECVGDIEFIDPDGRVRTYFKILFTVAPDVTRVVA